LLVCRKWLGGGAAVLGLAWAIWAVVDLRLHESAVSASAAAEAAAFAFCGAVGVGCFLAVAVIGAVALLRRAGTERGGSDASAIPGNREDGPGHAARLRQLLVLVLWCAGSWYLGTFTGPFVAVRHMGPCLVAIAILLCAAVDGSLFAYVESGSKLRRLGRRSAGFVTAAQAGTLAVTLVAGTLIGWADLEWAEVYREWAPRLAARARSYGRRFRRVYFTGHWGWRHYALAAGMVQYDPWRHRPEPGDVLVVPSYVDVQWVPSGFVSRLELVETVVVPPPWLPLRTRAPGALVFFHGDTRRGRLPWGWSPAEPAERFLILRVTGGSRP